MNQPSFKFRTVRAVIIGLALDILVLLTSIIIYGVIL